MEYRSIFSRSFGEKELKKVGFGAILIFLIMGFSFQAVFKHPLYSNYNKMVRPIIYNFTNSRSDVLEINGNIRIHTISSTIFISSTEKTHSTRTITPYARKGDNYVMDYVTTWKIINQPPQKSPLCSRHITIPAVIFSTGGYSGNHFHDFTDLLIPLYLTSQQFHGQVIFLISDKRSTWINKYNLILHKLSNYDFIDVNKENRSTLCFDRVIIGLRAHKEFGIDPSEPPHYSMVDFKRFLRSTYSLDRESVTCGECSRSRPRMLIVSRRKNRFITNEMEVANLARKIGFDVVVEETGLNVSSVAKLVNSFDVLVGVHGAGLTNMVFLPENGVVIQIIPFGADLWANPYFKLPAKDMKLRYLEYKVSLNESSLLGKYPVDSEVYRDPPSVYRKGFFEFHAVYLNNQNVTLELVKFGKILSKALGLIQG